MAALIIFTCLFISLMGPVRTQEEGCRYNLAIGYCPCTNETKLTQEVQLVIIEGSDGCDCTFQLCHTCSKPTITNIYDRECTWKCVNTTCVWNKEQSTSISTTSSTVKDQKQTTHRQRTKTTEIIKTQTTVKDIQTKDNRNSAKTSKTTTTVKDITWRKFTTKSKTTVTDQDITVEGITQEMTPTIAPNKTFYTGTSGFTGLWIWAGVFTLFTSLAFLKLYLHLRKQQPQYLPLNRSDNTETTYAPSYLNTTPSRPVIPQQILTPPSTSTPLKPSSRSSPSFHSIVSYREPSPVSTTSSIPLVPIMFFRDPSPEPSAPPLEDLESLSSESTPTSPIAARTRNMIKRKAMLSDSSL
ncbi:uncharacterized protein LOC127718902 [Mytilus californianus]|uniref:uncharacterized protein LOC127718902 n=1 Tax=Mytilus californianus TaxID=6549 RepID=UPI002245675A|nr:uncharacterized protein LOC127718902 [Mytilus californianus]